MSNGRSRWDKLAQFLKYRILAVQDSSHSIALGAAIGIFVAFLPPLGIHMAGAFILAYLFRANKAVAVAGAWISNPLTYTPIYVFVYWVGGKIASLWGEPFLGLEKVAVIISKFMDDMWGSLFEPEFWRESGSAFMAIAGELLIGGVVIGTVLAVPGYYIVKAAVLRHRKKHPRRRFRGLE